MNKQEPWGLPGMENREGRKMQEGKMGEKVPRPQDRPQVPLSHRGGGFPNQDRAAEGQGRLGETRTEHSDTTGNQHNPTMVAEKP